MKLGQLVEAVPAFGKIAACDLSPQYLYKVQKTLSKIDTELEFYNAGQKKIIADMGLTEISENKYKIPQERRAEYNDRIKELLEVEIEEIPVVKLPLTENFKLSYNDLCLLQGIIELEE